MTSASRLPPVARRLPRSVDQPDRRAVHAPVRPVLIDVDGTLPEVHEPSRRLACRILAFTEFREERVAPSGPNKPAKRLSCEIRRRTDSVGVVPTREAPSLMSSAPCWPSRSTNGPKIVPTSGSKPFSRCRANVVPTTDLEMGAHGLRALIASPKKREALDHTRTLTRERCSSVQRSTRTHAAGSNAPREGSHCRSVRAFSPAFAGFDAGDEGDEG